jgi:hypothetical protein
MTTRFNIDIGSVLALTCAAALGVGCGHDKPSEGAVANGDGGAGTAGSTAGAGGGGRAGSGTGGATGGTSGGGLDAGGSDGAVDVPPEAPTSPPVDCDVDPERCAFCTSKYATVSLHHTETVRGTWQYDPGGPYVSLPGPGYPCAAFLYDGAVRPTLDDDHWVGAPDGTSIRFSMTSTLTSNDYRTAQFRYFRSLVYVPPSVTIDSFRVIATGVDDSVHIILYNSKYPSGVSPTDAGPSDPQVGACAGNGDSSWELKSYAQAGEINLVFVIQADLSPTVSSLTTDITVNNAPVPLYDCVKGAGPPVEPGVSDGGAEP